MSANKNKSDKKVRISNMHPNVLVFYHEDYNSEELNEINVGRKGLSLFQTMDMDVPIPSFFVVSPIVYKDLLYEAFDDEVMELLEKDRIPRPDDLAAFIRESDFSSRFKESLTKAYSRLSGFTDTWVSVRASVVFPERQDISLQGLFETKLNVRGYENLEKSIKDVYASVFTEGVDSYARDHQLQISDLQLAIVIQRMVQAEVSGVVFTIDPITKDETKMSVEAVYGLGDVIARGEITPDLYLLNKKDLNFEEKHISPQEWMRVVKPARKSMGESSSVDKVEISNSWSHRQKLDDRGIQDVAKVALIVEDKSQEPQVVEWVWESGQVWILQTRPISEAEIFGKAVEKVTESQSENVFDLAVDIVKKGKVEEKAIEDAIKYVKKNSPERSVEKDLEERDDDPAAEVEKLKKEIDRLNALVNRSKFKQLKEAEADDKIRKKLNEKQEAGLKQKQEQMQDDADKDDLILSGLGASFGQVTGEVKMIESVLKDNETVTNKTILVLKDYKAEYQKLVSQAGGVITEEGGLASDIAVFSREKGVPLVLDADNASVVLQAGDVVKVDGSFGSVYLLSSASDPDEVVTDLIKKRHERLKELKKSSKFYEPDGNIKGSKSDLDEGDLKGVKQISKTVDKPSFIKDKEAVAEKISQGRISPEEIEKIAKTRDFKELVDKAVDKKAVDDLENTPSPPKGGAFSDLDQLVGIKREIQEHYEDKLDQEYAEEVAKAKKKLKDFNTDEAVELDSQSVDDDTSGIEDVSDIVIATKVMINPLSYDSDKLAKALINSDGTACIDLDEIIISHEEHPLSSVDDGNFVEYANKIARSVDDIAEKLGADEAVVSIGSAKQRDFAKLIRGRKYEDPEIPGKLSGINRYLQNTEILRRVLKIIRRVRNTFKSRNVSIGIHSPMNGEIMKEVKKEILAAGLHRTSSFNIYAVLDKSSEVIVARDIMEAEIDGVVLNIPAIVRETLGIGKTVKLEDYGGSLSSPSVIKIVNEVVASLRVIQGRVIVMCDDDKELIRECIKAGVYGISVKPAFVADAKKLVRDIEVELVSAI